MLMQVYNTSLGSHMGTRPPAGARVPAINVFYVDGGRFWIFSFGISQGARRRCFLALIVGALGSPALTPPRGPAVDIFYIDGGCFRISVSTSQGGVDVS
jgi:hypothetical protein